MGGGAHSRQPWPAEAPLHGRAPKAPARRMTQVPSEWCREVQPPEAFRPDADPGFTLTCCSGADYPALPDLSPHL